MLSEQDKLRWTRQQVAQSNPDERASAGPGPGANLARSLRQFYKPAVPEKPEVGEPAAGGDTAKSPRQSASSSNESPVGRALAANGIYETKPVVQPSDRADATKSMRQVTSRAPASLPKHGSATSRDSLFGRKSAPDLSRTEGKGHSKVSESTGFIAGRGRAEPAAARAKSSFASIFERIEKADEPRSRANHPSSFLGRRGR